MIYRGFVLSSTPGVSVCADIPLQWPTTPTPKVERIVVPVPRCVAHIRPAQGAIALAYQTASSPVSARGYATQKGAFAGKAAE